MIHPTRFVNYIGARYLRWQIEELRRAVAKVAREILGKAEGKNDAKPI